MTEKWNHQAANMGRQKMSCSKEKVKVKKGAWAKV